MRFRRVKDVPEFSTGVAKGRAGQTLAHRRSTALPYAGRQASLLTFANFVLNNGRIRLDSSLSNQSFRQFFKMVSVQPGHISMHCLGTNHGLFRTYKGPEVPDTTQPAGWASESKLGTWCFSPVVISRIKDEYSCFMVDCNHKLCQSDFDLTSTVGMQPFTVLGGELGSQPIICSRAGTLHIFHVGMDRAIYYKAWDGVNYYPKNGFERLEGCFLDDPAVVSCGEGGVAVFAIGATTGKLHHYQWTEKEGWKLQEDVEGNWSGALSAVSLNDGCWEVFGLDLKGHIIRVSYSKDADGKGTIKRMKLEGSFKTLSVIVSAKNRIDLIALDWNCSPYHKSWDDGDEGAWEHIVGQLRERPWLVCARPGGVCLYSVSFGYVPAVMVRNPSNGAWDGWHFIQGTVIGGVA
ncbi:hypothetical protein M422DRAFT_250215 [Sphaerobolus stellatus SS14]|uniref:Unplaced genomic scaffold SPHSTscaffold_33, whole genome shotgun sequence n=1 Tax=Sphaerobolus stellatus (strain SS14) TaxID=990650 RepID=A0A0C9VU46_SPHS4|nr:hypothetical protein M422DRAFT_250215 [Sphaerobolus stellatus SS14]